MCDHTSGHLCAVPVLLRLPQISRMPKASGARPRTVVITQGAQPTIVATGGRVTLYPVPKVGGQLGRAAMQGMAGFVLIYA
jgi:hypothetical protein